MKLSTILIITILALVGTAQADSTKLVNPVNGHSYQRFDTGALWSFAKDYCVSNGGYLVTITTQAENDWIFNNALVGAPSSYKNGLWLGGLPDISSKWVWATGETWNYSHWSIGEPSYSSYSFYNNTMNLVSGEWAIQYGISRLPFICEWDNPNYQYFGSTMSHGSSILIAMKNNNFYLIILDGTGKFLRKTSIGTTSTIKKLIAITEIDDLNLKGSNSIAILFTRADDSNILQLYNGLTLTKTKTVILSLASEKISPISISLVDDVNVDNHSDIEILFQKMDGTNFLQIRDGGTFSLLKVFSLPK